MKITHATGLALLTLSLVVGTSACRGPLDNERAAAIAGTYVLETIDGQSLPVTPVHQGGAPLVNAGEITLHPDGSFASSMTYGRPAGGEADRDFSGTYRMDDGQFVLRWDGAGQTVARLEGKTFVMTNEGVQFVYRRP